MKEQLFIPEKIKVGFQKRDDTYTKKLAYVTYYDNKGKLRKQKSWEGWIQKNLGISELENKPTEGFVLNKDVGGVRNSWSSWNTRMEKVRVYDPRGFEFEISIPNLLYILQECTSTKGKGLEGEFIYSWDKTELILLPVNSKEYQDCVGYTSLQSQKVSTKDMIPGHSYMTKKQETLIYLGKHNWTRRKYKYNRGNYDTIIESNLKHIFYNESNKSFIAKSGFTDIATKVGELVSNYAEIMDKLEYDSHISIPVSLEVKDITLKKVKNKHNNYPEISHDERVCKIENGKYITYSFSSDTEVKYVNGKYVYNSKGYKAHKQSSIEIDTNNEGLSYIKEKYIRNYSEISKTMSLEQLNKAGFKELYVVMKNGKKIKYANYNPR